jgi:hypothetical protein
VHSAVAYVVAGCTYILLGLLFKPALNWVVGPVWIVLMVWAISRLGARIDRRSP